MIIVVLAAGRGSRLGSRGEQTPKCLVRVAGKPLIDHLRLAIEEVKWTSQIIVGGYEAGKLRGLGFSVIENSDYETTTMVDSLELACDRLVEDFLIVYGDVIIPKSLVDDMVSAPDGIAVAVDPDWLRSWSARYDDPLEDAEELKIVESKISRLGRPARRLMDVDAHYIGVIGVKGPARREFIKLLKSPRDRNVSMTKFLSQCIDMGMSLRPVFCRENWAEIDTERDFEYASLLFGEPR